MDEPKNGTPILDEENHVYTINSIEYPSVTTIIQELNPVFYKHNPVLLQRGKYFHSMCHAIAQNVLDFSKLNEEEMGIAMGYSNALAALGLGDDKPVVEQSMFSMSGYAGTPDQVFFGNKVLIDLKFGSKQKDSHSLQLAAYFDMLVENYNIDSCEQTEWKLIAVYPQPNSDFDTLIVKDRWPWVNLWCSYVNVYRHIKYGEV